MGASSAILSDGILRCKCELQDADENSTKQSVRREQAIDATLGETPPKIEFSVKNTGRTQQTKTLRAVITSRVRTHICRLLRSCGRVGESMLACAYAKTAAAHPNSHAGRDFEITAAWAAALACQPFGRVLICFAALMQGRYIATWFVIRFCC